MCSSQRFIGKHAFVSDTKFKSIIKMVKGHIYIRKNLDLTFSLTCYDSV